MELQTKVNIPKSSFKINPTDKLLFVGSCFAENIGRRFVENQFDVIVNPYGTMYNPASVYHSVKRALEGVSGSLPMGRAGGEAASMLPSSPSARITSIS